MQPSSVVVVIPVHNALSQTARCLESVARTVPDGVRVIVVNDASDSVTGEYLRQAAERDSRFTLIEQQENRGFLRSANAGLARAFQDKRVELAILLNSDTVVTAGWIEGFLRCFTADERIGLATPVSNNAVNLSLGIPAGMNIYRFAEQIAEAGKTVGYPDVTTAIGFCLAVRARAFEEVGGFDEAFASGYGEDSDYHFRMLARGYRSVLVSDCFVYHESHASFSRRADELIAENRPKFDRRWSSILKNELRHHEAERGTARLSERLAEVRSPRPTHDVIFILPTATLCGGVIVVYEIVNRLLQRGVDAAVIVASAEEQIEMPLLFTPYFIPPVSWTGGESRIPRARTYIATYFETVAYAALAKRAHPTSRLAYMIQGYEGWFPQTDLDTVAATYGAITNRIVVSQWLEKMLGRWNYAGTHIPNGVDTKFFVPQQRLSNGAATSKDFTLFTLLRRDPQGGWRIATRVFESLRRELPEVRIVAVGDLVSDPEVAPYLDESYRTVDRREMAALYQSADAFLDCSMVQGFGLMGLEAMASGIPVVLTKSGGVLDYADESCALLCELGDENNIFRAIERLVKEPELRNQLRDAGRKRALEFDWEIPVSAYASFLTDLAQRGEPADDLVVPALNEFLVRDFLQTRKLRTDLLKAQMAMVEELAVSNPRGVQVLFEGVAPEFEEMFRSTPEGASLAAVYENARFAVARESGIDPRLAGPGTLFSRVRALVPPSV